MLNDYKIVKFTQKEIPNYLSFGIKNAPCVLYGVHDKPFVWICKEECCDTEFILNNNIDHIFIPGTGSSIVCSEGDLDLGFFGTEEFCNIAFARLSDLISKKLTQGRLINNDFMYDGNKYGSATYIDFGDCYYIGVHISNEINKDLIKNICKKKCYKEPEKLPVSITEEDILALFNGGEICQ